MHVSIVGTGYVGLVTGVCLAHLGHDVVCVDLDAEKVAAINRGVTPIHESSLPELLEEVVGVHLRATTDLDAAVAETEVTMLAVGTPFGEERIDLRQVEAAAAQLGAALGRIDRYHVVVVKSTVVPGTTEDLVGPTLAATSGRSVGADIGLAMNPEFLREGAAVEDFLAPDRIVLGGIDERTLDVLGDLYAVFDGAPIVRVDPRTAEMVKYASNALLATLISFSNEIGNLCAALGTDVTDVLDGVHLDRRLSPLVGGERVSPGILGYLRAGCGFGGSCFPKDVRALVAHGEVADVDTPLLRSVLEVNAAQPAVLVERLRRHLDLAGARIAVLGAAFKPGTDDVRESPALTVIELLQDAGAVVVVHDPVAAANAKVALAGAGVDVGDDLAVTLDGADAVVLVTAWPEYEEVPALLAGRSTPLVDGRRVLSPDAVARYDGIGYPTRPRGPGPVDQPLVPGSSA